MKDKYNTELYHYGILGMKWGVRRYQNKNGSLTRLGKRKRGKEEFSEDYKKVHDGKSVKTMSDSELKARNNRLQMEMQYNNMTRKKSLGKKIIQTFIGTAATITAAQGAYKIYKHLGDKALDVVGDWIVKGIKL